MAEPLAGEMPAKGRIYVGNPSNPSPMSLLCAPSGVAERASRSAIVRARLIWTLEPFQRARGFPRGRGKQHPGRVRSPFNFGVRARSDWIKPIGCVEGGDGKIRGRERERGRLSHLWHEKLTL
jgi:hypothetical protein